MWLEHVSRYASFYRMMLGRRGNAAFAAQLRDRLEARIRQIAEATAGDNPLPQPRASIGARFGAAGFLGVMEWWLEQQQPISIQEVAIHLHRLLGRLVGIGQ